MAMMLCMINIWVLIKSLDASFFKIYLYIYQYFIMQLNPTHWSSKANSKQIKT